MKQHALAVVFLHIGMQGKNGYETASLFRALPGTQICALVALTGWGSEANQVRSLEAGFNFHLTKPVDIDKVQRTLLARFSHGVRASALSVRWLRWTPTVPPLFLKHKKN